MECIYINVCMLKSCYVLCVFYMRYMINGLINLYKVKKNWNWVG